MSLKDVYANTVSTDHTINFFYKVSQEPKLALLAAPFFTYPLPLDILTSKGCEIRLIVRFSPITTPQALKAALDNPNVKTRYFTDTTFHSKIYIVDDVALVGSANLTQAGLMSNREVSILLREDRDEAYFALPEIFENLWEDAHVLTAGILKDYTKAFNAKQKPEDENRFKDYIQATISPASPRSVAIESHVANKSRSFIQRFRRKYDEVLIPAHDEILEVALENGFGRPEYKGQDARIEMGRFLGWLRITHGQGSKWRETSLLISKEERAKRIASYVDIWQSTDDTVGLDMYEAEAQIVSVANIKKYLNDSSALASLTFDEIFDYLAGCHAFSNRLRFADKDLEGATGIERLRTQFKMQNRREDVVRMIDYLLSGHGDAIERAYDCIHSRTYRLNGFKEACVMELLGWADPVRPPFNNRSIRGIRLLGFDGLCCTNRLEAELPLTPDGFSLESRYAVYQEL
jgi:hypothetical protein